MTPIASTAIATDEQQHAGARVLPAFKRGAEAVVEPQTVPMGLYFIHNAVPMKGATPAADGRCLYLLECFPIAPDATPGQVAYSTMDVHKAQYKVYYGHISRERGEAGMTVGYVYRCAGTTGLDFAGVDDSLRGPVMTETVGLCLRSPKTTYDTDRPRYGDHNRFIQSYDEQIATEAAIKAIRHPAPKAPHQRRCCI